MKLLEKVYNMVLGIHSKYKSCLSFLTKELRMSIKRRIRIGAMIAGITSLKKREKASLPAITHAFLPLPLRHIN